MKFSDKLHHKWFFPEPDFIYNTEILNSHRRQDNSLEHGFIDEVARYYAPRMLMPMFKFFIWIWWWKIHVWQFRFQAGVISLTAIQGAGKSLERPWKLGWCLIEMTFPMNSILVLFGFRARFMYREHIILLSRERVNKGRKRMNSLRLSPVVTS